MKINRKRLNGLLEQREPEEVHINLKDFPPDEQKAYMRRFRELLPGADLSPGQEVHMGDNDGEIVLHL